MALARHEIRVLDLATFKVVPNAFVEVKAEATGQPLAILFAGEDGVTLLPNPFQADANGVAIFHVIGGYYQVRAYSGTFEEIRNLVRIGTSSAFDIESVIAQTADPIVVTAAGAVAVGSSDLIVVINKAVPEITTVNLPVSIGSSAPVTIKDGAGNAASFPITIVPDGVETIDGASSHVIDFDSGSITLTPYPDGSGWFRT